MVLLVIVRFVIVEIYDVCPLIDCSRGVELSVDFIGVFIYSVP